MDDPPEWVREIGNRVKGRAGGENEGIIISFRPPNKSNLPPGGRRTLEVVLPASVK